MFILVTVLLYLATIILPVLYYYKGKRGIKKLSLSEGNVSGQNFTMVKKGKKALAMNIFAFFLVTILSSVFIFSGQASATPAQAVESGDTALAAAFIAAALVTGLGAIGTGIAVSSAAAAAIGAISENENNFGKAMIFVAMAEGIAIYGLLISFMILGRV